jgi:hypothetical protein
VVGDQLVLRSHSNILDGIGVSIEKERENRIFWVDEERAIKIKDKGVIIVNYTLSHANSFLL